MDSSSDVASLVQRDNNILKCRKCTKSFNAIGAWEMHNFFYHMNLKYMCTHCNFRYLDINHFVKHMKFDHHYDKFISSIGYSYCSICRNLFTKKNVFENHIFYCHVSHPENVAMYFCRKCTPGREMSTYDRLVTHDGREHRTNLIKLFCYVCGKLFSNFRALSAHKNQHYIKKVRKCVENSCNGRIFATLIDLKEHIRESHPERFLCTRCFSGVSFMSELDLQKHVGEYHRDQLELL